MREICFYRTQSGACPVEEFLAELGSKHARKVAWVLRLVKELPMVPQQYFKKLEGTENLWEIRADFGGDAARLLGFWDEGRLIILTNAFLKKTRQTPVHQIALAEQRRSEYLNRKKKP